MTGPTGILIYHPTGSKPMSPGQLGIQFGLNLVQALLAALLLEFMPFRLEDIAVGGKLISEGGDPDYYLEVSHPNLNEEQKQTFVREVTPLLVRLLNLGPQSWLARLLRITDPPLFRISILFNEYDDTNFAVGGRFTSELERRDTIVAKLVENGRDDLVASKAAENSY